MRRFVRYDKAPRLICEQYNNFYKSPLKIILNHDIIYNNYFYTIFIYIKINIKDMIKAYGEDL